jgi:hypothetical protein
MQLFASERSVQEHVKKYKTGAAELKDLIQQVLHHPDFNPEDVDHDMHELLMECIAVGNVEECLSLNAYFICRTSLLQRCVDIPGYIHYQI